jgi:hypothetical protein
MQDRDNLEQKKGSQSGIYISYPDSSVEAVERGRIMAHLVRQELRDSVDGLLEEGMNTLRGRSWS